MAGHIQDRWWRDKKDENGDFVLNDKGKRVREKTDLYGKGLRYKVRYPDPNNPGKETSESFPDKQLTRAKNFLSKVQVDVLTGSYVDPSAGATTLESYVVSWRKGQSQDAHTVQTVTTRLNGQIWPFFGRERALATITPETIRDWLGWMHENKAGPSYQASVFELLSAILGGAVDDKKIHTNPCNAKSIQRPRTVPPKIVPWPVVKVRAIQLALPPRYKIIVPIGAGEGLRQMEILGLSPDDIDREAMELHVNRQIRWIGKTACFAPPKGGKTRVVPLGDGVLDEIDTYSETFEPIEVTLPWLEPDGKPTTVSLLIPKQNDGNGRNMGTSAAVVWRGGNFLDEIWKPAFERAGQPYGHRRDGMHAMRHYYASNLLADGVSIKEVSEYLGHADPGYTLRRYTHLVPSSHSRARAASNKIFKPTRSKRTAADPGTA